MEKLPPRYLRLTEKHSISKRFEQLCMLAEELHLSIIVDCGRMFIRDTVIDEEISIIDCDSDEDCIDSFPPTLDFYFRKDNPEYIKACKIQQDKYAADRKAVQNELNAKKAQEEVIRKAQEEFRVQEREKEILAKLKAKYE